MVSKSEKKQKKNLIHEQQPVDFVGSDSGPKFGPSPNSNFLQIFPKLPEKFPNPKFREIKL